MVKLGNLSTDGTKIEANASRHKAMSYGYMTKELARLEKEIEQLLEQADRVDAEQDAALGSRRGDELPDELKRREDRLAKIREAKERLEAEARERAAEEQRERDAAEAERQAAGKKRRGKEPAPVESDSRRQGANQLHRPRCENHETQQQGLRLLLQRAGRGGQRAPDHRGRGSYAPPRTTSNKRCRWPKPPWPTWPPRASNGRGTIRASRCRSPTRPTTGTTAKRTYAASQRRDSIRTSPWAGQKHHASGTAASAATGSASRAASAADSATAGQLRRHGRGREPEGRDGKETSHAERAASCMRRGSTSWNPCSARSNGFAASASSCSEVWNSCLRNGN